MPTANATALIDGLRAPDGSLNRHAVRTVLPYGDAFLFVDHITRLSASDVEATYWIPPDAPYVLSHFLHTPLMPGVLTGEGMAQAGAFLIRYRLDLSPDTDILVTRVERAVFSAPALPGDTLHYTVTLKNVASYGARLAGRVEVGDLLVCTAQMVVVLVNRQRLQQMTVRT
ncbi:MAG: 3-hydroxyacyl-ACP dehydratase FabZ family protein [Vicinamibacterales bacterium]